MPRTTIAALLLLSAGCYHASIESGMKPGSNKIEEEWASGWAWGLVGPQPIEAQSKCTSGVSKVETEHSFLNGLVQFVTLGIYTPGRTAARPRWSRRCATRRSRPLRAAHPPRPW